MYIYTYIYIYIHDIHVIIYIYIFIKMFYAYNMCIYIYMRVYYNYTHITYHTYLTCLNQYGYMQVASEHTTSHVTIQRPVKKSAISLMVAVAGTLDNSTCEGRRCEKEWCYLQTLQYQMLPIVTFGLWKKDRNGYSQLIDP